MRQKLYLVAWSLIAVTLLISLSRFHFRSDVSQVPRSDAARELTRNARPVATPAAHVEPSGVPLSGAAGPGRAALGVEEVVPPTAADIQRMSNLFGVLLERSGGDLQFSRAERNTVVAELCDIMAVNSLMRSRCATVTHADGGVIVIDIRPDPDGAVELAKMARARMVERIGPEKTRKLYERMGDALFDDFHGYGLGDEHIVIEPSLYKVGGFDVSYNLTLTSANRDEVPDVFPQKGGDSAVQSKGVSWENLSNAADFGVLRILLKKEPQGR